MWVRYLPGLVAAVGAGSLIIMAPARRKVESTILATLVGLTAMEAEYWVAHGFPADEIPFFIGAVLVTIAGLVFAARGGLILGIVGLGFLAYVNIRYGSPYLLDYILPVNYALLVYYARRALDWRGRGFWAAGRLEALWVILTHAATIWRTSQLDKWGWLAGDPW